MFYKYLSFILLFPICLQGKECSDELIEFYDACYNKDHINVLQDFVDLNPSLSGLQPQNIGHQKWTNNQLTYLYLGSNNIETIPDSIGLLKGLLGLDLRENKIKALPDGICDIYPFYTEINLGGNQICPKYPFCFDYIGDQDIGECENFKCPHGFMEIDGECFNKEHIQILQNIIDINPRLDGIVPLELGNEIGYLGWKNGKLNHLNLLGHGITRLPESLCYIYKDLDYFDVSNNSICPPYPECFEFIGFQNTGGCNSLVYNEKAGVNNIYVDNWDITSAYDISSINFEYFQSDINILKEFINNNESLWGQNPLQIGIQKWTNMRLTSLDLSDLKITYIPAKLCDIYSNLTLFDVSDNEICPPFPNCIEYIGKQKTEICGNYLCPENYIEIDKNCYHIEHFTFLEKLIDNNASLSEAIPKPKPLEIGNKNGVQKWRNGKIEKLVITGNNLNKIPQSICNIYDDILVFDISNNAICPPYPPCIKNVGYQNIETCEVSIQPKTNCPDGYVSFDGQCYNNNDLQTLIDVNKINPSLSAHHPMLLGYQLWKNGRLYQLSLNDLQIVSIPESIKNLDSLVYLNLNNNLLSSLPETFCNIFSNLDNLQIANNLLCPPYLSCFDFIGDQNTKNCEHQYCPYGYEEIEGECYFEKDISVLQDFINHNASLSDRNPLDVGIQKWVNMRLNYLYLGVNEMTIIPESICTIISNLKTLNISQNNVCPPYPDCVEDLIGEQDTTECP